MVSLCPLERTIGEIVDMLSGNLLLSKMEMWDSLQKT